VNVLWAVYAAGALVALWRTDAGWPTRIALALLWPIGPLAFLVTVAILLGASLIAFPVVAGIVGVLVAAGLWWVLR
jgi:hypothetical protein